MKLNTATIEKKLMEETKSMNINNKQSKKEVQINEYYFYATGIEKKYKGAWLCGTMKIFE